MSDELTALADALGRIKSASFLTENRETLEKSASAIRSYAAAQEQEPVGYGYSAEIQSAPGDFLHVCREKKAMYDTPLYLSPPPAAGWDKEYPYDDERFNKGVLHVVDLIARNLGVDQYVAGDGSEDYDCDLWQTILNILAVKGLYDKDEAEFVAPRTTLAATKSADAGGGVRVKPLVWNEYEREGDIDEWDAETALGTFYTINRRDFCYTASYDHIDIPRECQSPEEAKDVAQADYERRILSALSHQPAPVAANASAEARLREALEVSGDAIDEYYRYWTGGESRGSYDGRPERANLWKAMYAVRAALKALSAHPHASDCDKQVCMGDASPCDPKDLQELLSKPSVLEPSDRTTDVPGLQPFSWRQVNAYEACNGTIWRTAKEARAESKRATDAYGMWRR